MSKLTKIEAVEKWVNELSAISTSKIERLFDNNVDNLVEHTPIIVGDYVYYEGMSCQVAGVQYIKDCEGVIDNEDTELTLEACTPKTKTISANEVDYIFYEHELIEVKGMTDNFEFIIEEEKIPFKDVEAIAYNDVKKVKVLSVNEDKFEIKLDNFVVSYEAVEHDFDGWLPMWGTMWIVNNSVDVWWIKENLEIVARCGFRIFEDDVDGDIILGIDGAGYDFYEAHWIPLYEARSLEWHKED